MHARNRIDQETGRKNSVEGTRNANAANIQEQSGELSVRGSRTQFPTPTIRENTSSRRKRRNTYPEVTAGGVDLVDVGVVLLVGRLRLTAARRLRIGCHRAGALLLSLSTASSPPVVRSESEPANRAARDGGARARSLKSETLFLVPQPAGAVPRVFRCGVT
jgi:hypothetical protein